MSVPITVLILNDHEVVQQGLHAYLEALPDIHVVGEAPLEQHLYAKREKASQMWS